MIRSAATAPSAPAPRIDTAGTVFVLTSSQEGLGTVILDAQAAGVPVVATRAGGIPELLRDGAGILAAPGGVSWPPQAGAPVKSVWFGGGARGLLLVPSAAARRQQRPEYSNTCIRSQDGNSGALMEAARADDRGITFVAFTATPKTKRP